MYGVVPPVPFDITAPQFPGQTALPVAVTVGPDVQLITVMLPVTFAEHPEVHTV